MIKVLIHFKESAYQHLDILGLKYTQSNEELDVIVDDVPYTVTDGIYHQLLIN